MPLSESPKGTPLPLLKPLESIEDFDDAMKEIAILEGCEPDTPKADRLEALMWLAVLYERDNQQAVDNFMFGR